MVFEHSHRNPYEFIWFSSQQILSYGMYYMYVCMYVLYMYILSMYVLLYVCIYGPGNLFHTLETGFWHL